MHFRAAAAALALALVVAVATGCQPEPTPTPTAPAFANEAEAFAAAEATYRAYVDALNARRTDAASDPDPQTLLTGKALEIDIATQQQLDQAGLVLTGATQVNFVGPGKADVNVGDVRLDVCLDSTATRVLNGEDEDVTPTDRQPLALLTVDFVSVQSRLLIAASTTKIADGC